MEEQWPHNVTGKYFPSFDPLELKTSVFLSDPVTTKAAKRKLLVWDSFRAHTTPQTKDFLKKLDVK